ncbi:MAG: hypothetical protein DRQ55_11370 [Planctomycetota bacterium]|nr:MAG: hypothetical protein DRQ55_11370 [Planctomycetota bacterium]
MPTDAPLEDAQVHRLDAGAAGGSKLPFILGVVALLALAGAGAWVVLTDPFAGQAVAQAPPAADDNLLGDAWSFETTEDSSPGSSWFVPDDAPAGFSYTAEAAVSGAAGAAAIPSDEGWSRAFASQSAKVRSDGAVEIAAVSAADGVQLLLRFEAEDLPPFDLVLASGQGDLSGRAEPPPGYDQVRAGIGCLGAGSLDDVVLRHVPGGGAGQTISQGVYDVSLGFGRGLIISRDNDLVLRVEPTAVRPAGGRAWPGLVAQLPGESATALRDGGRVSISGELLEREGHPVLVAKVRDVPAGATLVTQVLLLGPLASTAIGVRAGGRYDHFTEDFEVQDVDSLVLGRTQDRLVLDMVAPFSIQATHINERALRFVIEREVSGDARQELTVAAGFQAERVQAAGLLSDAHQQEAAGQPGAALTLLERIVTQFPYDEQVLEQAGSDRARLVVAAAGHLEALRADLDDAVFLGNPGRCRDVGDAAAAARLAWGGDPDQAEAFDALISEVHERAGAVLARVDDSRRRAISARLESFRADGRFPHVVAEIEAALAALPSPAEGSP